MWRAVALFALATGTTHVHALSGVYSPSSSLRGSIWLPCQGKVIFPVDNMVTDNVTFLSRDTVSTVDGFYGMSTALVVPPQKLYDTNSGFYDSFKNLTCHYTTHGCASASPPRPETTPIVSPLGRVHGLPASHRPVPRFITTGPRGDAKLQNFHGKNTKTTSPAANASARRDVCSTLPDAWPHASHDARTAAPAPRRTFALGDDLPGTAWLVDWCLLWIHTVLAAAAVERLLRLGLQADVVFCPTILRAPRSWLRAEQLRALRRECVGRIRTVAAWKAARPHSPLSSGLTKQFRSAEAVRRSLLLDAASTPPADVVFDGTFSPFARRGFAMRCLDVCFAPAAHACLLSSLAVGHLAGRLGHTF